MTALVLATAAALGTYYLFTALVLGWTSARPAPGRTTAGPHRDRLGEWFAQAGLDEVAPTEFVGVVGAIAVAGTVGGAVVFGAPVPAVLTGVLLAALPMAAYRGRRMARRRAARDAWPRLIDEIRLLTTVAGRSVPQALLDAGLSGPEELRPAFAAAQREWLLTRDFERTVEVLTARLADPTADATCETLLVAHEVGGTDVGRRLEALAEDRRADVADRKDAGARQAGARFARRFVLLVPAGMALAGMSVGTGRDAYRTAFGQVVVAVALLLLVACWVWAGRTMRLPDQERVFRR